MRNFLQYLIYIFILFSISSCNTNDPDSLLEKELPFFKVSLEERHFNDMLDHWLVITNSEGELLGYRQLNEAGEYEFIESTNQLSEELGVYIFYLSNTREYFRIEGYLSIPKGDTWILPTSTGYGTLGEAEITIINFPKSNYDIYLPTNNNSKGFIYDGMTEIDTDPYDGVMDSVVFPIRLMANPDTLILSNSYKDYDPRYLKITGIVKDMSYTYDFEKDFVPFDQVVSFEFESEGYPRYAFVAGEKNQHKYYLSLKYTSANTKYTQFGYLAGFDVYHTSLNIDDHMGFDKIRFYKYGDPVLKEELVFEQSSFSVYNTSLSEFEYTCSNNLEYKISTWSSNDGKTINIYDKTNSGFININAVPLEIIELFPFLKIHEIPYSRSEFISIKGNFSYRQFIDEKFKQKNPKAINYSYIGYWK